MVGDALTLLPTTTTCVCVCGASECSVGLNWSTPPWLGFQHSLVQDFLWRLVGCHFLWGPPWPGSTRPPIAGMTLYHLEPLGKKEQKYIIIRLLEASIAWKVCLSWQRTCMSKQQSRVNTSAWAHVLLLTSVVILHNNANSLNPHHNQLHLGRIITSFY